MSEQEQEGEIEVEEAGEPSGEQEATPATQPDTIFVEETTEAARGPQRYGKATYLFNWLIVFLAVDSSLVSQQ